MENTPDETLLLQSRQGRKTSEQTIKVMFHQSCRRCDISFLLKKNQISSEETKCQFARKGSSGDTTQSLEGTCSFPIQNLRESNFLASTQIFFWKQKK